MLDEPLSNLDAKLRLEARAFLKHLQQEVGVTAVYVTHDQAEAMALADRIVVMNEGRIMQVGTPQEIYRTPANEFVASFIGSPPMNLLPCRADGHHVLIDAGGDNAALQLDHPVPDSAQTLGVRPEYITLHAEQVPNSIPAQTYVTQMLGSESLIVVYVGEYIVSARIFGDDIPHYPDRVWLTFNPDRLYFYDEKGDLLT